MARFEKIVKAPAGAWKQYTDIKKWNRGSYLQLGLMGAGYAALNHMPFLAGLSIAGAPVTSILFGAAIAAHLLIGWQRGRMHKRSVQAANARAAEVPDTEDTYTNPARYQGMKTLPSYIRGMIPIPAL